jgi:hypothetical protein
VCVCVGVQQRQVASKGEGSVRRSRLGARPTTTAVSPDHGFDPDRAGSLAAQQPWHMASRLLQDPV